MRDQPLLLQSLRIRMCNRFFLTGSWAKPYLNPFIVELRDRVAVDVLPSMYQKA